MNTGASRQGQQQERTESEIKLRVPAPTSIVLVSLCPEIQRPVCVDISSEAIAAA